ncbi:hypothetical protein CB0940_11620, partial [Cercospora beticola]
FSKSPNADINRRTSNRRQDSVDHRTDRHIPLPPSNILNPPSKWRTNAASSSTSTSHASALLPTASSRPRTTPLFRSPSQRLTRTAARPARTRLTPSAVSSVPWARATMRSTDLRNAMDS